MTQDIDTEIVKLNLKREYPKTYEQFEAHWKKYPIGSIYGALDVFFYHIGLGMAVTSVSKNIEDSAVIGWMSIIKPYGKNILNLTEERPIVEDYKRCMTRGEAYARTIKYLFNQLEETFFWNSGALRYKDK